jgi:CRP-like cAMP-binding protein
MPTDPMALGSLDLFAEMKPAELERVQSIALLMQVAEAEILTRIGAPAHNFFIVLSGNFMIVFKDDRAITLHDKGKIMGWSTVFTPFRYKGTTIALTEGEVLSIPGDKLLNLIQSAPALGDKIMKKINTIASERMFFAQNAEPEEGF